jgi:hypothetical protein
MHALLAELYLLVKPWILPALFIGLGWHLRRRGYLRDPESAVTRAFTALESTAYTMVAARVGDVRNMKRAGSFTAEEAERVRAEVEALVHAVSTAQVNVLRAEGRADPNAVVRAVVEAAVEKHRVERLNGASPRTNVTAVAVVEPQAPAKG